MNRLFRKSIGGGAGFGLLLVRLVFGIGLMMHGWPKLQHPFHWMHGSHIPPILQAISVLAEVAGGLGLVVGLLTPVAAFGVAINMAVAVYVVAVVGGHPFIAKGPSYELPANYLVVALLLLFAGPGNVSLDAALFK